MALLPKRPRQPEVPEDTGVRKAGDRRYSAPTDGEDHDAVSVCDRRMRVAQVATERRLPIRPRRDEPDPVEPPTGRHGGEEATDRIPSLVLERLGGHREPRVVGE